MTEPLALILITTGGWALVMLAVERVAPWPGPAIGLKTRISRPESRDDVGTGRGKDVEV